MNIQDLIAEKKKQIAVLERHIQTLTDMAAEEGRLDRSSAGSTRSATGGRKRRRRGASRAGQIETYLRAHAGPQPAKEIASALGFTPAEVHSAVNPGLKTGRFVRGKRRATYGLGSRSGTKPTPVARRKRRRTAAKRTARRKRLAKAPMATVEASA